MSIVAWLRRQRLDDEDLQDEIRAHLAMAEDERIADGADPRQARRDSLKEFGNVMLTREAAHDAWTPRWIDALRDLFRDVRYASRVLAKSPAFALTVAAVLTVGIGLNASVFTLLKSLALSPIAGVDGSYGLGVVVHETSAGRLTSLSYPDYTFVRDHNDAFAGLVGVVATNISMGSGQHAERIMAEFVSGNYFEQLGVRSQRGRVLGASDDLVPSGHPVVVLSDLLWRRRFGASPDVIGTTIRFNTYPLTVVGIADASFHGTIPGWDVEAFIPIMMTPEVSLGLPGDRRALLTDPRAAIVIAMGRLRAGRSIAEASAQMVPVSERLETDARIDAAAGPLRVIPIWQSPFGAQTYMLPAVTVLSAMGALLLLIVCANVAGLVIARGVSRRGEIALRLALGASRRRILRLLLVEHLLLAIPAGILALILVPRVIPALVGRVVAASPIRIFLNVSVDWLVIVFSVTTALASALVFGLLPAIRSSRTDLLSVMKEDLLPRGTVKGRLRAPLAFARVASSLRCLLGPASAPPGFLPHRPAVPD